MTLHLGQDLFSSIVLASVAAGTTAGTELGASATDGQLGSGSAGFSALTDEGAAAGLPTNEAVPTGAAGVRYHSKVTYEAGETISPGDAVGIDGGQLRAANSGDTSPNPIGIAGHGAGEDAGSDYASGENVPVYIIE